MNKYINRNKKKKKKMARQIKINKNMYLAILCSVRHLEPGFCLKICVGVFFCLGEAEESFNAQISCDSCQSLDSNQ